MPARPTDLLKVSHCLIGFGLKRAPEKHLILVSVGTKRLRFGQKGEGMPTKRGRRFGCSKQFKNLLRVMVYFHFLSNVSVNYSLILIFRKNFLFFFLLLQFKV